MDQAPSLPVDSPPSDSSEDLVNTEFLRSPSIPDHQVLRRIGRGSYGDVWLGRNIMGVYRAIKIVYRKRFESEGPFERELSGIRKFEPISRSHEGFVDVLHVGINKERGYFYYVMELGDEQRSGQNIDPSTYEPKTLASDILHNGRLAAADCLRLGLKLSSALAELHRDGLVHRDVKPSNIIFVDNIPKLADIGLVTDIGRAVSFVGTEGFVPPEGPGTPQADVYGLGKILYEASTGKDRQEFPRLPVDFDKLPDRDLFLEINAVVVHACVGERIQRYQSADAMHADMQLLAGGKSVKRLRFLERRWSQVKRFCAVAGGVTAIIAAIAYPIYREWKSRAEARDRQVGADIAYGNAAMDQGDLLKALPYFVDALRLDHGNPKTEAAHRLRIGSVLAQCPKLTRLWIDPQQLKHGEFSPDGKHILVAQHYGDARIYDLNTSQLHLHPFGQGHVGYASYSPDGKLIVTAGTNTACLWDVTTLKAIRSFEHPGWVCSARFNSDGSRIVTAGGDGFLRVWETLTGKLSWSIQCSTKEVLFADFSHNGKMIVTAGRDHTATIRDATGGGLIASLSGHSKPVTYAAFNFDDSKVVTSCEDHKARVWRVGDWATNWVRILPDLNHPDGVISAEFSPDGRILLTASLDGTAHLFQSDSLEPLNPNPVLRHNERLAFASFAPNGHEIVTCCIDGAIRIWDLCGAMVEKPPSRRVFSADGSRFFIITNDLIQIGDAVSDKVLVSFTPASPICNAEINGDGHFLVSVSLQRAKPNVGNHRVQLWDAEDGRPIGASILIANDLKGVAVSDDGKYVAIILTKIVQVWDPVANRPASPALIHEQPVSAVVFAPNGGQIATLSGNVVQLWNARDWHPVAKLKHATTVRHVEYSRNGLRVLSCCSDSSFNKCYAQIWNSRTGESVGPQLRHRDGVSFASFSRDGRFAATASEDFTSSIWDVQLGRQLPIALQHAHEVRSGTFNADGRWLVTASLDHTARVWDCETGAPLTPSLRHLEELFGAIFLSDGGHIATTDKLGNSWVWKLSLNQMQMDDLTKLAELLSSGTIAPSKPLEFPSSRSLRTEFEKLRAKHPAAFGVSSEEITFWHEFEARESESERDQHGLLFHVDQLLSLRPGDPSLLKRRTDAIQVLTVTNEAFHK